MGKKNFTLSINALNQCFSTCGPQNILQWATEHFGKSRIFKKSCLKFLFPGDNLFLAGKSARSLVKTFFFRDHLVFGRKYFKSGPWKIFKIKMGHGYKKVREALH